MGKHTVRKRFGQNFLHDMSVIDKLISHLRPSPDDTLIEVGPGLGALTYPLLAQAGNLTVIEIDRDLVERLQAQNRDGLSIISGDVLSIDFASIAPGKPLRIVGNLPYNIGTPLLLRLLEQSEHIKDVHVMLQKEVVDRLSAVISTKAYGRLSVMMQSSFAITPLFTVPPTAFEPAPKVQSAVVRLVPLENAPSRAFRDSLENITRVAFANRRKTLRNNLREHLDEDQIRALDIDPGARAETLTLEQFTRLAQAVDVLSG